MYVVRAHGLYGVHVLLVCTSMISDQSLNCNDPYADYVSRLTVMLLVCTVTQLASKVADVMRLVCTLSC
jgi:hypothetical protein